MTATVGLNLFLRQRQDFDATHTTEERQSTNHDVTRTSLLPHDDTPRTCASRRDRSLHLAIWKTVGGLQSQALGAEQAKGDPSGATDTSLILIVDRHPVAEAHFWSIGDSGVNGAIRKSKADKGRSIEARCDLALKLGWQAQEWKWLWTWGY